MAVEHRSTYAFDRPVRCAPHELRLRPASWSPGPVEGYRLAVAPDAARLRWSTTRDGAWIGRLDVPGRVRGLELTANFTTVVDALDPREVPAHAPGRRAAGGAGRAGRAARRIDPQLLDPSLGGGAVADLVADLSPTDPEGRPGPPGGTMAHAEVLARALAVAARVTGAIAHEVDHGPGPVAPGEVLARGRGSCRDSAWVLVQACRAAGLPARFVTGYLLRATGQPDLVPGPWPEARAPEDDVLDLHAWAEVGTADGGWIGVDPTTARPAGGGHVPLAAGADPAATVPVRGATEPCEVALTTTHHLRPVR